MAIYNTSIRVVRIERTLYQELTCCPDIVGQVGRIYEHGFDIVRKDGRFIHFRNGKWLHAPFGVVLDEPVKIWVTNVSLREGDVFVRKGQVLLRLGENGCGIHVHPTCVVDLKKRLCPSRLSDDTLLCWIRVLADTIVNHGTFEGMGGTLRLLEQQLPGIVSKTSVEVSPWSKHALVPVKKLVQSVIDEDLEQFCTAWGLLVGLGPGLTPAGDDFLAGFMAAHTVFSSSFGRLRDDHHLSGLVGRAKFGTTAVAYQFLRCAVEGMFSEILYAALSNLLMLRCCGETEDRLDVDHNGTDRIEYFLRWGHSSGTDTLTGVVFGLWSMLQARG
jgi:hypothetical protein